MSIDEPDRVQAPAGEHPSGSRSAPADDPTLHPGQGSVGPKMTPRPARHRWMVFMPFEIPASDARKMSTPGALPTTEQVPHTELLAGDVPHAEDPRPWFGLHNVVNELVTVGCYVCEQVYSDEIEAAGCPGDPTGQSIEDLHLPGPRVGLSTVGRNDPCPCGSGRKYKRCHGATP